MTAGISSQAPTVKRLWSIVNTFLTNYHVRYSESSQFKNPIGDCASTPQTFLSTTTWKVLKAAAATICSFISWIFSSPTQNQPRRHSSSFHRKPPQPPKTNHILLPAIPSNGIRISRGRAANLLSVYVSAIRIICVGISREPHLSYPVIRRAGDGRRTIRIRREDLNSERCSALGLRCSGKGSIASTYSAARPWIK